MSIFKKFAFPVIASALASILVGAMSMSNLATAAPTEPYAWKNVRIDGGGFVPGIIFNRTEANLMYARTDMGGAYRWDATANSWVPLLDWVGWDNWGWNGVISMATDPINTNRVYAAVGMYTNGWDPTMGGILRSTDRGATWKSTLLPFHIGGNMPGRGMGERLVIDPNNNNILYFGAEGGNGLWRSTDAGVTWAKVTNFPNVGNYAADPADVNNYSNQLQGVVWVAFDPSSSATGVATKTLYVGVADKDNSIYRSKDAGATWERVPGQPIGFIPHKGVLDPVNGFLYIATSDTGGPYDGGKGDVWKLQLSTDIWTNISPVASTNSSAYFGYGGLTIDRKNPNTLMVASMTSWWPDAIFYRTTNGGTTWSPIWEWSSYPSRLLRYTLDIAEVPWLNFGNTAPVEPEPSPKLGWMTESMEIDPHNSNRMLYGTGATIYSTTNLTNWDSGGQILIKPLVKGLEETAVLDVVSPPTGAPVYSALGDIGGFRHDDVTKVPASMYTTPNMGSTNSIDYAELNPATMVRVGNGSGYIGVTTSSGSSWWQGQLPTGVTGGGTVAMAADGGAIVWSTVGAGVQVSTTYGSTWVAATGVPASAIVEADRVNPAKFYAVSGNTFYVSTNKGASFTATTATGLPSARKFKAVFGREGDIWLAGGSDTTTYGLWHSTDSGATFTKLANVQKADNVDFGKAATGSAYPTVFTIAQIDGVRGVFRSTDIGANWVRINDDQHQYGNFGEAITGDKRIYGRLYLGTNGRGLLYGESAGIATSSAASSVASSVRSSTASSVASSVRSSTASSVASSVRSSTASSVASSVRSSTASSAASSVRSSTASSVASSVRSSTASSVASSVRSSTASSVASSVRSSTASSVASSVRSSTASSVASSVSSTAANKCTYVISNQWGGGFIGSVSIKNNRTTAINGWTVSWTYSDGSKVSNAWNATLAGSNPYTATAMSYNSTIQPGQTAEFGFQGTLPAGVTATAVAVTGAACN